MDALALAREIAEMGRFMDREALAGRSVALIAAKQSAQFEAKLARIAHLTAQQANDLSDAFMRVSFTVDQKSTFASKIADTLGGDIRTVATTKTQMIDIENYMPPQLWEILDDTSVDIGVKSLHVANLFAALEVTTASEPSIARAAVVLATIGLANVVPSVDTLHNLHIHLTAGVKAASAGRAPAFAPLLVYPLEPRRPSIGAVGSRVRNSASRGLPFRCEESSNEAHEDPLPACIGDGREHADSRWLCRTCRHIADRSDLAATGASACDNEHDHPSVRTSHASWR